MKKIILLSFLCLSSILFAQDQSNAGAYMDYFSEEYQVIQEDMWEYTKSVSHGRSARTVEKRRNELISTSNAALSKAKRAKGFAGDESYKNAVVDYFELVNIVLKEDYAKIVDMEAIAEQSYDDMEAYMMARDMASDKQTEASEKLSAAQKEFAAKNDVELIESSDSMDEKMEIAGEVYDHYNEVYLIFFKSNKQEVYLLDAISAGDLSAIEQNKEALMATIKEGRAKLKELTAYSNDKSMIEATLAIFDFYEQEVEDVQLAVDYFLKTENFNKIKEGFDQIKEKNRTQQDVDQYNGAINDMNGAIEAYNSANETNNKTRSKSIDAWNDTAKKFTAKHVPKGN
jgi:hypothetical protein